MKLPKTKTGLFVVMRVLDGQEDGTPVGIFAHAEDADNYCGHCDQLLRDSGILAFNFKVSYVMFYN